MSVHRAAVCPSVPSPLNAFKATVHFNQMMSQNITEIKLLQVLWRYVAKELLSIVLLDSVVYWWYKYVLCVLVV